MSKKYSTIRLILGDQLNSNHSWFGEVDDEVVYVLMEISSEREYVKHHIQKIVGIFQAMRTFADELKDQGHSVQYFKISDKKNKHSFVKNCKDLISEYGATRLEISGAR